MTDLISTIDKAISLTSQLRKKSENMIDADFKNLLSNLALELACAKSDIVDIQYETQIKRNNPLIIVKCSKYNKEILESIIVAPESETTC
ncbi:MAG: hypothetical protein GY710_16665 [Desulfobacteraceae bacterium]|nr:hypothetical protein [Desulfobacteraceae bacterium]